MTERKQISLQKDDAQAALDALDELDAVQDYLFGRVAVDGSIAGAMAKSVRDKLKTIRAALTAQLTKTDDNVSCPRVANTGDINAELLEALNIATNELEEHSKCEDCQVGVPLNILNKCHGAIARAEQKVGE